MTISTGKIIDSRIQKYLTLLEVSKSIGSHRCLPELFHDLAHRLHGVLSFDYLSVLLHDPSSNVMRLHTLETSLPNTLEPGSEYSVDESPAGWVWQTQQPLVVDNLEEERRFAQAMKILFELGVRSFCSLPLTTAHRRLGAVSIGRGVTGGYALADLEFLQLVAGQVAVAVDNALRDQEAQTLQSQLAHERNRLQLLLDVNNKVVSNLDLREIFQVISNNVRRVMQCDYASLSLPDSDNGRLRLYALDFPESKGFYQEEMVYSIEGSPSGTAFRTLKPVALQSPFTGWDHYPIVQIMVREGLKSSCFLPLISRKRAIGTLNLGRLRDDAFSEEDVHFLSQVAGQIAIAVENALDYRQVTESRWKLAEERLYLQDEIRTVHNFEEIIGESAALKRVLQQVETVAPPFRWDCWKASYSATKEVLSPVLLHRRLAGSSWPTRERFFSTRSAMSRWSCSPSCSGYCKSKNSSDWAVIAPSVWMFVWSQPRVGNSSRWSRKTSSAVISITA